MIQTIENNPWNYVLVNASKFDMHSSNNDRRKWISEPWKKVFFEVLVIIIVHYLPKEKTAIKG